MSEINDAAVEAGARALFEETQELGQENSWDDPLPGEWREAWRDAARETLTAALPHLTPEPRVITTAEEMEALPVGIVLRSDAGTIACRYDERRGVVFGDERPFAWGDLALPATVLHTPKDAARD